MTVVLNLIAFVTASLVAGEVFDMYEKLAHWDTFLHAWAGLFMAAFLFPRFQWYALPITLATLTNWEVFEYLMDLWAGTNMQKDGIKDTMEDIMVGKLGAFLGFGIAKVRS